jgi:hypothetical protein
MARLNEMVFMGRLLPSSPSRVSHIFVLAVAAIVAIGGRPAVAAMPNPALTPGDVNERDRGQVCTLGNAERRRSVSYKTRDRVYLAYGILRGHRKGLYRIDHLIPLELGGSNRATNLWPQPYADSKLKDDVENELHQAVCRGSMSLDAAQRAIARNWHTAVPTAFRY